VADGEFLIVHVAFGFRQANWNVIRSADFASRSMALVEHGVYSVADNHSESLSDVARSDLVGSGRIHTACVDQRIRSRSPHGKTTSATILLSWPNRKRLCRSEPPSATILLVLVLERRRHALDQFEETVAAGSM